MFDLKIALPTEMVDWVHGQVKSGRCSSASEYVRKLIAWDQENEAKISSMQALIDEARAGGLSDRSIENVIATARAKARANAA